MNKIVFFLGAGASKCAGGPLIGDFVTAIRRRIEEGGFPENAAEVLDRLAQKAVSSGRNENNIEDLLWVANDEPETQRRDTIRLMSLVIGLTLESCITFSFANRRLTSRDYSYGQLASLIADVSDCEPGSIGIVTVNYDICADVAINEVGREPYYCLNPDRAAAGNEISLAKLHGSLNWAGCAGSGCGYVDARHHLQGIVSKHGESWPATTQSCLHFPKNYEERCQSCGEPTQFPLIVPPVEDKSAYGRDMRVIWEHAGNLLRAADFIAIVGYSCAELDKPVNELIREAGEGKTVLIANPSEEARNRAQKLLPSANLLPPVGGLEEAIGVMRLCSLEGSRPDGFRPLA